MSGMNYDVDDNVLGDNAAARKGVLLGFDEPYKSGPIAFEQVMAFSIPQSYFRAVRHTFDEWDNKDDVQHFKILFQFFMMICREYLEGAKSKHTGDDPASLMRMVIEDIPFEGSTQIAVQRIWVFGMVSKTDMTFGKAMQCVLDGNENDKYLSDRKDYGRPGDKIPVYSLPETKKFCAITDVVSFATYANAYLKIDLVSGNSNRVFQAPGKLEDPQNPLSPAVLFCPMNADLIVNGLNAISYAGLWSNYFVEKNVRLGKSGHSEKRMCFVPANKERVHQLHVKYIGVSEIWDKMYPWYLRDVILPEQKKRQAQMRSTVPGNLLRQDLNTLDDDHAIQAAEARREELIKGYTVFGINVTDIISSAPDVSTSAFMAPTSDTPNDVNFELIKADVSDIRRVRAGNKPVWGAKLKQIEAAAKSEGCTKETEDMVMGYMRNAAESFISAIMHPNAKLCESSAKLVKHALSTMRPEHIPKYSIVDPSMGLMSNIIAYDVMAADKLFAIANAHHIFTMLQFARLDAYRFDYGLHINVILHGPAATSKSFLLEKIEAITPGASKFSRETKSAYSVDKHDNDSVRIFHELSIEETPHNKDYITQIKERLTSQKSVTLTFEVNPETRKRTNRKVISEAMGVIFGATNENANNAENAFSTRFSNVHVPALMVEGRTVTDAKFAEAKQGPALRARRILLEQMYAWRAVMHFLVEKLMEAIVIPFDVNVDVTHIFLQRVERTLAIDGHVMCSPRANTRVILLARHLCIYEAIVRLFCTPVSYAIPKADATVVDLIRVLPRIVPMLSTTIEHSVIAMSLLGYEFVSPAETAVLVALGTMATDRRHVVFANEYLLFNDKKALAADLYKMIPKDNRPAVHVVESVLNELLQRQVHSAEYVYNPTTHTFKEQFGQRQSHRVMAARYVDNKYAVHVSVIHQHMRSHTDLAITSLMTGIERCDLPVEYATFEEAEFYKEGNTLSGADERLHYFRISDEKAIMRTIIEHYPPDKQLDMANIWEMVLSRFSNEPVDAYSYKKSPDDIFPVVDTTSIKVKTALILKRHSTYFIHLSLLYTHGMEAVTRSGDVLRMAVERACSSNVTRASKYIYAKPFNHQNPNVFQTITTKKVLNKKFSYNNPVIVTDIAANVIELNTKDILDEVPDPGYQVLSEEPDMYGRRAHLRNIFFRHSHLELKILDTMEFLTKWANSPGAQDRAFNYPIDIIREADQARLKRRKEQEEEFRADRQMADEMNMQYVSTTAIPLGLGELEEIDPEDVLDRYCGVEGAHRDSRACEEMDIPDSPGSVATDDGIGMGLEHFGGVAASQGDKGKASKRMYQYDDDMGCTSILDFAKANGVGSKNRTHVDDNEDIVMPLSRSSKPAKGDGVASSSTSFNPVSDLLKKRKFTTEKKTKEKAPKTKKSKNPRSKFIEDQAGVSGDEDGEEDDEDESDVDSFESFNFGGEDVMGKVFDRNRTSTLTVVAKERFDRALQRKEKIQNKGRRASDAMSGVSAPSINLGDNISLSSRSEKSTFSIASARSGASGFSASSVGSSLSNRQLNKRATISSRALV